MEKRKIKLKLPLPAKLNRNVVLAVLLLLGVAWSITRIMSAPPDPGHGWTDIGDSAGDALTADRGGTGATTLTANSALMGNNTSAVTLVAPGTTGNLMTSNGTVWAGADPSGAIVMLYSDETNSVAVNNTTETVMKYWVMTNDPAIYTSYILEAEVLANRSNSANSNVTFTFNFNESANIKRSIIDRMIGSSLTGIATGGNTASTVSVLINNSLPASANLILTGDVSGTNTSATAMAHSFRVYGVK